MFLNVALKEMNMHPSQTGEPFTVKMTGGPDGDVAGNMIKILRREYGDQVKILGLADATGCAEDPEGLDMDELMRLVRLLEKKLIERAGGNFLALFVMCSL